MNSEIFNSSVSGFRPMFKIPTDKSENFTGAAYLVALQEAFKNIPDQLWEKAVGCMIRSRKTSTAPTIAEWHTYLEMARTELKWKAQTTSPVESVTVQALASQVKAENVAAYFTLPLESEESIFEYVKRLSSLWKKGQLKLSGKNDNPLASVVKAQPMSDEERGKRDKATKAALKSYGPKPIKAEEVNLREIPF